LFCSCLQPNIDKNIGPDDWRYREAATFVFGCILEGPSPDQLAQLVVLGLNFLLQVLLHHPLTRLLAAVCGYLLTERKRASRHSG